MSDTNQSANVTRPWKSYRHRYESGNNKNLNGNIVYLKEEYLARVLYIWGFLTKILILFFLFEVINGVYICITGGITKTFPGEAQLKAQEIWVL